MLNDVFAYDAVMRVFKIKIYDANCKHANVLLHRLFGLLCQEVLGLSVGPMSRIGRGLKW